MPASPLPRIMVAPNGARRTRQDHPALPITVTDIVADAIACHAAGAGALHAHVRDADGRHVLDAGLYRELIAEMGRVCPRMLVQVTTEAVGRYMPVEQRALVEAVQPAAVSVALGEMMTDDAGEASVFYHAAAGDGVAVQHILYDAVEVSRLAELVQSGGVPAEGLQLLFVLGRYSEGQQSDPSMLDPFIDALSASGLRADWAVCAFGTGETACLRHALARGGKVRVGFENSLWREDGSLARDNAQRVADIAAIAEIR